ncbi:MAG: PspA/IM30 family protein [Pseudomonadota bacterium]
MALINRISRLFTADVHALLDNLEEPEVVLKQALRDMRDVIAIDQSRLNATRQQIKQNADMQQQLQLKLTGLREELDLCMDSENAPLARNVMRRYLLTQKQMDTSNQSLAALQTQEQELNNLLAQQANELESLTQKVELLHVASGPGGMTACEVISDEEVEVALLRHQQARAEL